MVMAQSLFKVLRQRFPSVQIDVLAPAWSRPILEAMPEVRLPIDMPVGHGRFEWSVRRSLAKALKRNGYEQALVLPNSLKSALIPWLAGIPLRTGWTGEMRFGLLNDRRSGKERWPLMVQRYVALAWSEAELSAMALLECPPPRLVPDPQWVDVALERFGLTEDRQILALCPGAEFGRAKKWPERHYAVVARQQIEQGGCVWLFGSQKDRAASEMIASGLPPGQLRILAGRTSLQEAVALMSRVDRVVSNDSGLMHVAAALERPLVALYGSTSPAYTPPLNRHKQIIQADIACSPCFKRECPYGHYKCLEDLEPKMVTDALSNLSALSLSDPGSTSR
jgi:heptosyltransferase-2